MRSYRHYCGLARALDVVGDRWTLLIVRELLALGPSRYTDLRNGLPGIATNLLVDRLREMEGSGIIERVPSEAPIATDLFRLTERGRALTPVIAALGVWAAPALATCEPEDEFRSHWLALPLELHLIDRTPHRKALAIEVRTGDRPITIHVVDGAVRVRPGCVASPDAVMSGSPDLVLATLLGHVSLTAACRRGLRVEGSVQALRRLKAKSASTTQRQE